MITAIVAAFVGLTIVLAGIGAGFLIGIVLYGGRNGSTEEDS